MKNHDLRRFIQSYGTLMALAAITLVFCVIRPASFCTVKNFINITRQISLLVMISLGATAVMSVNEFDLSIGSMASLGGVMAALLAVRGLPMVVCFLLPIVVSVAIGLVNGWIVARFRVLSFITTLGMSTVLSGVIYRLSGGATIFENIPDSFSRLGTAKVGQLPLLSILMAVFTALFFFLLEQTTLGRKLYAIGVPYMALIANAYLGKGLTFWQVLKNGMLIYLPGDMLKIAAGSALSCAVTRRVPNL